MIINNVKLVLENEVVHGSLEMQDGEIRAFAESQSHLSEAMDGDEQPRRADGGERHHHRAGRRGDW